MSAAERVAGQLDVDEVLALVDPNGSSPAVGGSGGVVSELVGDGELGVVAAEVAARQRSLQTRRAYAGAYRAFCVSLGPSPTRAHEQLFVSLPRTGRARSTLGPRDVGRLVERYARAAGVPDDRRSPHALRHTFCTLLAATGAQAPVIRELAGHADMRTTSLYTDVDPGQLQAAIGQLAAGRRGLRRAAR